MKKLIKIWHILVEKYENEKTKRLMSSLGESAFDSRIYLPVHIHGNPKNIIMKRNSHIYGDFRFISVKGKFVFGENSGAAQGLTVITDNHVRRVGHYFIDGPITDDNVSYKNIVVDDDVWIGANVTLCDGCHISRGAVIGAGAVVRTNVPPYAIVFGNPAKIIGFVFNPAEVKEHESLLYKEDMQIDFDKYARTYKKYYIDRVREISSFCRL